MASGKRMSSAPWEPACRMSWQTLSVVASRSSRTGEACTTPARTTLATCLPSQYALPTLQRAYGGPEDDACLPTGDQDGTGGRQDRQDPHLVQVHPRRP